MDMTLLDSGATGMFIGRHSIWKHNLETSPLAQPVPVHNVDGTLNENRSITEEVEVLLWFGRHTEWARFAVANLGCQTVIIGCSWLLHHNPEVDWVKQKVTLSQCPPACNGRSPMPKLGTQGEPDFMLEPGDKVYAAIIPLEWGHELQATSTPSQQMAQEAQEGPPAERPFEELVPEHYRDFRDVFSKEAFDKLPPQKPWDHAIDLAPDAKLPRGKTFPLSQPEQKELDEFLCENLQNRCIQPSKSPMGALVFFVKKKDGSLHL